MVWSQSIPVYHVFLLDQTGRYRLFVENDNPIEVEAEGVYMDLRIEESQ